MGSGYESGSGEGQCWDYLECVLMPVLGFTFVESCERSFEGGRRIAGLCDRMQLEVDASAYDEGAWDAWAVNVAGVAVVAGFLIVLIGIE